jgi:sugar/nucleoside kinase (ribokinase family)
MGDAGATFLGFMLGLISLDGAFKQATVLSIFVPILALGLPIFDNLFVVLKRLKNGKPVYVTLGEYGIVVFDGHPHKVPAFPAEGPLDVVGAGDAYNAAAVFALAKGAGFEEAALAGNAAASIVIKQIRVTGTAKLSDILTVLGAYKPEWAI